MRTTAGRAASSARRELTGRLGGPERTRVVLVLAAVLALSGADTSTVGAAATQLRHGLRISNTDIGLMVTVSSLVAALASLPFGVLADRVRRTPVLAIAVASWGVAMVWSATAHDYAGLLRARVFLGVVTAAAGPVVASLVGDYFDGSERGRIYGFVLAGEMIGAGFGFAVAGDLATLSWRASFVSLALPAFAVAWLVARLREPARGGQGVLPPEGESVPADDAPGPVETDAQRLAREHGLRPHPELTLTRDPRRMSLYSVTRYVLRIRTNLVLIAASACGYYFLAGVETFGVEFAKGQYGVGQAVANLLLLVLGVGAVGGVLAGGTLSDALLQRHHLNARVLTSAAAAAITVVAFVPALLTHSPAAAVPYLVLAAFCLSAQNPPLDAARLDIMVPLLWGRAESIRTLLRSLTQSLAPFLFGAVAEHVFGGGQGGLRDTFVVMLLPLMASAVLLFRARRTYPADVATAAASARAG